MTDLGDKVEPATRSQAEAAIAVLRDVLDKGDKLAIEAGNKALTDLSNKLVEQARSQADRQSRQEPTEGGPVAGRGGVLQNGPLDNKPATEKLSVKDIKKRNGSARSAATAWPEMEPPVKKSARG